MFLEEKRKRNLTRLIKKKAIVAIDPSISSGRVRDRVRALYFHPASFDSIEMQPGFVGATSSDDAFRRSIVGFDGDSNPRAHPGEIGFSTSH